MYKKIIHILISAIVLMACKATKQPQHTSSTTKRLSTKKIIKQYHNHQTQFSTLKASLKTQYIQDDNEEKFTTDIRIKKDQVIWASIKKLGFSGAKIYITPTRVQFYNKLDKTFFDGDFSLISNLLGTPITFKQLQAMLLGELLFPAQAKNYRSETLTQGYLIAPKHQDTLLEHFVTLHPDHFKVSTQEIAQPNLFRILNLDYPSYQTINEQNFPAEIKMTAVEKTSQTQLSINFRNVSLNQELRFPFKIPQSYKELVFE